MGGLTEHVQTLEALCHRYLNQPNDELERAALVRGLAGFRMVGVTDDQPTIVRGLAAQCHAYAGLLSDDLASAKSPDASVRRLCGLLADLREALD
ncbi:hypothetical protein RSO01_33280 [Reyranella soli]|uniref:HPt domain-containing protein n=1 Tax=Reyranella soli TaxID=1230389 RepID=A0A512NB40_9HYPH|nr:hypothetical protein RSO01_33280 [Reyranella soli]